MATSQAAVKRSVWTARRAAALRAVVDNGTIRFYKVESRNNCADMFTRPIPHADWVRFMQYVQPAGNDWMATPADA